MAGEERQIFKSKIPAEEGVRDGEGVGNWRAPGGNAAEGNLRGEAIGDDGVAGYVFEVVFTQRVAWGRQRRAGVTRFRGGLGVNLHKASGMRKPGSPLPKLLLAQSAETAYRHHTEPSAGGECGALSLHKTNGSVTKTPKDTVGKA